MLAKVVGIRAELTEPLVYSDADVVFLQPSVVQLLEELGDRDCAFQNDNGECCAGFFVMHNTKESLTLLDNVISDLCTNINDDQFGDQKFLNERLKSSSVKYRLLSARFANPHTISGSHWTGRDLRIPRDTLMFHANWTEGILNKELLLDMVIRNARRTIQ